MLVMLGNMSQDFLAQIQCYVDVIALIPKLTQASKSCQKLHGFTEIFLNCTSGQGVEVLEGGTQNQLESVRPVT